MAQKKYKSKYVWVRKVIHWKLCKKLKFPHTNKWYMHKLEYILENETRKILREFEIQTDLSIPARRPDRELINKNKRIYHLRDFAVRAVKRLYEKDEKYRDLSRELKRLRNMKATVIPMVFRALGTVFHEETGWAGDQGKKETVGLLKISQDTRKSPGDMRRLAVTQTPVKKNIS